MPSPSADNTRAPAAPLDQPLAALATPAKFSRPDRKQLLLGAGLAALVTAAYLGMSWWTVGRFQVSTDDAYVSVRSATLSPKIAGYVTEIVVADNSLVKAGDLIARVDPGDYDLAVRAARDQCETQRSSIDRIGKQIAGQQAVVDQMKAQAVSTRAAATRAELELKRQSELADRRINSPQALEQAQSTRAQAVAGVAAADAAVASAVANVAVFEAQRIEAQNILKQNETALAKAERDLSFAEIRAPFEGVLGNRAIQVGDYVQPAQRMASLIPLKSVYIDANFKETQLARLKPGQIVKIKVDAEAGQDLVGRVVSVAPASGSVFSLLPPDNATGNFTKIVQRVPVRIAIPEDAAAKSVLRPGMSVFVSVDTRPGHEALPEAIKTSQRVN